MNELRYLRLVSEDLVWTDDQEKLTNNKLQKKEEGIYHEQDNNPARLGECHNRQLKYNVKIQKLTKR